MRYREPAELPKAIKAEPPTINWTCIGPPSCVVAQVLVHYDPKLAHILLSRNIMNRHILVVDDEAQIRDLLSACLSEQGYEVSTAETSPQTLQILAKTPIDLVIIDLGLGQGGGLKLVARLKEIRPRLRGVMLTGMGFAADLLQKAHQMGADGNVSQLPPLSGLISAIHRLLKLPESPFPVCLIG